MKKHILIVAFALALCIGLAVPVFAAETKSGVTYFDLTITNVVSEGAVTDPVWDNDFPAYYTDAPTTVTSTNKELIYFSIYKAELNSNNEIIISDEYVEPAKGSVLLDEEYGLSYYSIDFEFTLGPGVYYFAYQGPTVDPNFIIVVGDSNAAKPAAPAAPAANAVSAKPTASRVVVDGQNLSFDAYNINGNNYFKLRDLAYALSGTQKQFDVGWDGAANAITLTSGKAYTAVGGEMASKGAGDKTATPTSSKITLNGGEVSLTAYNIGGNNYFKLRDIAQTFDFGVFWDGDNNMIFINAGNSYTPE